MDPSKYGIDFNRILFGNLPWTFLIEVALRTTIIYFFALLVVRLLGKRGMGQLAPFDFVIIIALGSAVGDPMFYPQLPLLHSMVAITGVVILTRGVVKLTERSERVKNFIASVPTRLVVDGRLDLKGLEDEAIARGEVFEALRGQGVQQLGQVERAYLEPSGDLSAFLFRPEEIRPGLALLPDRATKRKESSLPPTATEEAGNLACANCGATIWLDAGATPPKCPRCSHQHWEHAVYTLRDQARAGSGADAE